MKTYSSIGMLTVALNQTIAYANAFVDEFAHDHLIVATQFLEQARNKYRQAKEQLRLLLNDRVMIPEFIIQLIRDCDVAISFVKFIIA